jgi:phage terminase small subunit
LLRNAQVAARIAELTEAAADASSIAAGRVLDEMGAIALANVLDYVTIGADGLPRIDFSGMTRKQAAALVEITVDEFTDGAGDEARPVRRVRFKLGEKFGALVKLGQGLGLFKDRVRLEGKIEVESKPLTDIEAARQIAFLLHQAMNAPTPAGKP